MKVWNKKYKLDLGKFWIELKISRNPKQRVSLEVQEGGRIRHEGKWFRLVDRYNLYDGCLDGKVWSFMAKYPTEEDIEMGHTETTLRILNAPRGWGIEESWIGIAGVKTPISRQILSYWVEEKGEQ